MSNARRVGLVVGALAVAVVAFVALRPSGGSNEPDSTATQTDQGRTQRQSPPAGPVLRAGAVKRIVVRKGSPVRFRARSAKAEEVHVHGYNLLKDVPAGETVSFSFRARFEGEFEIEFERAGERIGVLEVRP